MHLSKLNLLNFKNYEELELSFSPHMNALVGMNGAGKTNILDAVYYLSMCKSYLNAIDKHNIKFGNSFFTIQGAWNLDEEIHTILCAVKLGAKKIVKKNKVEYEKLSDHIGLFPVVFISPYDGDLIADGSEMRRKWIDGILSQLDRNYLDLLIQYGKVLDQRNALLKIISTRQRDPSELDIWDDQLVKIGKLIHAKRVTFIYNFRPVFEKFFNEIGVGNEQVEIIYKSQLTEVDFTDFLLMNRSKDISYQYSTAGIHKDDLTFLLNGHPVKKFGSQGQQKSFLIALRLAQYEYLKTQSGKKPILLLDDIFDKLDSSRVGKLIELVSSDLFGQVIITDTDKSRLEKLLKKGKTEYSIFEIPKL